MKRHIFLLAIFSLDCSIFTLIGVGGGGGLLPYCYHPINGRPHFLLGYESWRKVSTADPNNKGAWTDFGGACDPTDSDKIHCSCREFAEESRHVFGNIDPFIPITPAILADTTKSLQKSIAYGRSHISSVGFGTGSYTQYYAHVDYIPEDVFEKAYDGFPHADEKTVYLWVDALQLVQMCAHRTLLVDLPQNLLNGRPKAPKPHLYSFFVKVFRNPVTQAFISDTILQPFIDFLPYYITATGAIEILVVEEIAATNIDLSQPVNLLTTFNHQLTTPPDFGAIKVDSFFACLPPDHTLLYPVLCRNKPIGTTSIDIQDSAGLDASELSLEVKRILASKQGKLMLKKIVDAFPKKKANTQPSAVKDKDLIKSLQTLEQSLRSLAAQL